MKSKEKKPKKGFTEGYKTYNTENGFGNRRKWQRIFNERIGREEAAAELADLSPWEVLEVSQSATKEEIKQAFYKLIKIWHPDMNAHRLEQATEMSKKIIAAYSILTQ